MEKYLQLIAAALAIIAGYFIWKDNFDWAFAFVVFAICSAFLAYRFKLRERVDAAKEPIDE